MADEKDLSKDTEEVTQESETVTPEKGAKTAKSDKDAPRPIPPRKRAPAWASGSPSTSGM